MAYYSQHGEDILLHRMFENQEKGFFVEVGCIDGLCFSNTMVFEEMGWSGICVEAHAGYIDLLRKNRPNSLVCHFAAGEKDESTVFYANARGSLSTLDKTKEKVWKKGYGEYFSGFEEQKVSKIKLSSLFDQLGISEIDILSLDIEGYEIEALKGLDLSRHRPKALLIESDSLWHEAKLDCMLLSAGYCKSIKFGGNIFYVSDYALAERIEGKVFEGVITHTQHPLDSRGDKCISVKVGGVKTKDGLLASCLLALYKFMIKHKLVRL